MSTSATASSDRTPPRRARGPRRRSATSSSRSGDDARPCVAVRVPSRRQLRRPCDLGLPPRPAGRRARVPGALLMSAAGLVSLLFLLLVLGVCIGPLGRYMAKVYGD